MGDETRQEAAHRLDEDGYARLLRGADTYRERLVLQLAGAAGLRPTEIAVLRFVDVSPWIHGGRIHYFLTVRDGDGDPVRTGYLPPDVQRELERYVTSNDIAPEVRVFEVTPRRLQMLVTDVVRRVAADGAERLREVSSADLRRYFGRSLLERGVDPRVVRELGGWSRLDRLLSTGDVPTREEVAAAFTSVDERSDDRFRAALERLERPVALLDADGSFAYVNHRFEEATGLAESTVAGQPLGALTGLSGRSLAELWETALAGDSWVGETTWGEREENPDRQVTLSAIERLGDTADGFLLTLPLSSDGDTETSTHDFDRLRAVQSAASDVGRVLADAYTREEVLEDVCDVLAAAEPFVFALASEAPTDGTALPQTWAGIDETVLERSTFADGERGTELVDRTIETGEVHTTAASLGPEVQQRWLVAVPLVHGETTEGALVVGCPTAPSPRERATLANVGERVGSALAAVEWKRLLLTDRALELEFQSTDSDSFFVSASEALGGSLRLEGLVPLEGGGFLYYIEVSGAPTDEALSYAADELANARLIADYGEKFLLEATTDSSPLLEALVRRGGNVRELSATGGTLTLVCEFAPSADVRELVDGIDGEGPTVDPVAKREVERSTRHPTEFRRSLEGQLTDKQHSVLRAAYHAGYFDWPRGSTAEELADTIGVSSPTLHNHLRRAQRKLLAAFFNE